MTAYRLTDGALTEIEALPQEALLDVTWHIVSGQIDVWVAKKIEELVGEAAKASNLPGWRDKRDWVYDQIVNKYGINKHREPRHLINLAIEAAVSRRRALV